MSHNVTAIALLPFLAGLTAPTPLACPGNPFPPTKQAVRVMLPNCSCTYELIKSGTIPACLTVTPFPGPGGDCTPHCNDVPTCESDSIGCCPTPGHTLVKVNNWASCCSTGHVRVDLNGTEAGTITQGVTGSGVDCDPTGGTGMACTGMADSVESAGDKITVYCWNGLLYSEICTFEMKDKCKKCPG